MKREQNMETVSLQGKPHATLKKARISIFVSGNGTNAENFIRYFQGNEHIEVASVLCNHAQAPVIERLKPYGYTVQVFDRESWKKPDEIVHLLQKQGIDLIVLAGFLAIVHEPLLSAFEGRIVNIHPSLLPKFGEKGMWGHHVHEAVVAAGEKESGITVHLVSGQVDGGAIVDQRRCPLLAGDTPESLEARVHALEYRYYPEIVEQLLLKK